MWLHMVALLAVMGLAGYLVGAGYLLTGWFLWLCCVTVFFVLPASDVNDD